jgi:phosphoglycolate phosphatase-like HAD superfamily hydrolase
MVGDTTVDIRAGVAAGTQTVGVLCGFGERHELERAKANLILESTTELADVLLSI